MLLYFPRLRKSYSLCYMVFTEREAYFVISSLEFLGFLLICIYFVNDSLKNALCPKCSEQGCCLAVIHFLTYVQLWSY